MPMACLLGQQLEASCPPHKRISEVEFEEPGDLSNNLGLGKYLRVLSRTTAEAKLKTPEPILKVPAQ